MQSSVFLPLLLWFWCCSSWGVLFDSSRLESYRPIFRSLIIPPSEPFQGALTKQAWLGDHRCLLNEMSYQLPVSDLPPRHIRDAFVSKQVNLGCFEMLGNAQFSETTCPSDLSNVTVAFIRHGIYAFRTMTLLGSKYFRVMFAVSWHAATFWSVPVQFFSGTSSPRRMVIWIRMRLQKSQMTRQQYIGYCCRTVTSLNRERIVFLRADSPLMLPLWPLSSLSQLGLRWITWIRYMKIMYDNVYSVPPEEHPLSRSIHQTGGGVTGGQAAIRELHIPLQTVCRWLEDDHPRRNLAEENPHAHLKFYGFMTIEGFSNLSDEKFIQAEMPLSELSEFLTKEHIGGKTDASFKNVHDGVKLGRSARSLKQMREVVNNHACSKCETHLPVFEHLDFIQFSPQVDTDMEDKPSPEEDPIELSMPDITWENHPWPPLPPSDELQEDIIRNWCNDTSPDAFEEKGCAVCARLTPVVGSVPLNSSDISLNLLKVKTKGSTRKERHSVAEPVRDLEGPILSPGCNVICPSCYKSLLSKKVPNEALCNGLWLGEIPSELKDLSFAEQMVVQRIRPSRCSVRVARSGRYRMSANAIMYPQPTLKIHRTLPPPSSALDEVLCVVFSGSSNATPEDLRRTPLLIRRNKVSRALNWLKLNHRDYADIIISEENLNTYKDNEVPVYVRNHRTSEGDRNKDPLATSIHDRDEDEGTEEGPCTFAVHGITGTQYATKGATELKALAMAHLHEKEKSTLIIGQGQHPSCMYDDESVYPQMFPWLFPYGLGGISNRFSKRKLDENKHKAWLLMYHDKRFQEDRNFPIIAFNHLQIKSTSTGSFVMSRKKRFGQTVKRLQTVDKNIWKQFRTRIESGEHIDLASLNEEEQKAWKILGDIDQIGNHVRGSMTSKKYMRNEIWSASAFHGAPSWFITVSPVDNRHPIALYYADHDEKFNAQIKSERLRYILSSQNPVSAARFFDYMVRMFIKHILGENADTRGFYGDTAAYYGTVEQQGRLTLHLHLILWIKGALSPDRVRELIKAGEVDFEQSLLDYFDGCHDAEYYTGTQEEIVARSPLKYRDKLAGTMDDLVIPLGEEPFERVGEDGYLDPTKTLPLSPPDKCLECHDITHDSTLCERCCELATWRMHYLREVDDLRAKSNTHRCIRKSLRSNAKGCLNNDGICEARFPREHLEKSQASHDDGFIKLRHIEPWQNRISPVLTYLMRCNTDVSSLSSGTAIKGVIAYVTDYISKAPLKSHHIFSAAYDIFDRNPELTNGAADDAASSTRKLLMKLVNAIGPKLEIGSPMACLHLLGNPDHYTGSTFPLFWWKSYVDECYNFWGKFHKPAGNEEQDDENDDVNVLLTVLDGQYVASTNADNYVHRPLACKSMSLYEWTQCANIVRRKPGQIRKFIRVTEGRNLPESYHPGKLEPRSDSDDVTEGYAYSFRPTHPLYKSSYVIVDPSKRMTHIPNMVGATLPRKDHGNREYYCCAMLTFFKPWTNPSMLKQASQTWNEAFAEHTFSERQKTLMAHLNLRYECLDERHDFKSMLRKQQSGLDRSDDNFMHLDDEGFDDYAPDLNNYMAEDSTWARQKAVQEEMARIAKMAGYFDRSSDGPFLERPDFFVPPAEKSRADWSNMVKNARSAVLDERSKISSDNRKAKEMESEEKSAKAIPNEVKIVDNDKYFSYLDTSQKDREMINSIVADFGLDASEEQDRSFRLVANHITSPDPSKPQLKMYLGGMGGTGKSQVLKALSELFKRRHELYRFSVVAPTGSAAALLNGTTYHHMFGLRGTADEAVSHEHTGIATAKERLKDADYIFLDEISMVSASEFHNISSKLCHIMGCDEPFGGLNFIVAGDFAQLAPPSRGGKTLYNEYVNSKIGDPQRMTVWEQSNILGKTLWHQFTTVVILRKNMRQTSSSVEDTKLRRALEHMRYGACNADDITFLNSLVASRIPGRPSAGDEKFRHVSVITTHNNDKDALNDKGSLLYAADTGQHLTTFYSRDYFAIKKDGGKGRKAKKDKRKKRIVGSDNLSLHLQRALWSAAPSRSEQIPATLSLCVGLPVLIRYNEATELCITKGQEAKVVGWTEGPRYYDMPTLETVFVELVKPPKAVQIPDLPPNVVPISSSSAVIEARTPNGATLDIKRFQVKLLPNFGMTDFSAQGKSRSINVVHLSNCQTIHNFYTALSRGTTAAGTLILDSFDAAKLQKRVNGGLRQEFRDLDMLDEITELRYLGKLPSTVSGTSRNALLRSYLRYRGAGYKCKRWDPALQWDEGEDRSIQEIESECWSSNIPVYKKTKREEPDPDEPLPVKKRKRDEPVLVSSVSVQRTDPTRTRRNQRTLGFIWDSTDHSCPYDGFLTVLWSIWAEDRQRWESVFCQEHRPAAMHDFIRALPQIQAGFSNPEVARDAARAELARVDPMKYPYGPSSAYVGDVAHDLLDMTPKMIHSWYCPVCGMRENRHRKRTLYEFFNIHVTGQPLSVQASLNNVLEPARRRLWCTMCSLSDVHTALEVRITVDEWPDILTFGLMGNGYAAQRRVGIDKEVSIASDDGISMYSLKGITYFKPSNIDAPFEQRGGHYVSRMITEEGAVYFNDGIIEKNISRLEGQLDDLHANFLDTCPGGFPSIVYYTRER